MTLVPQSDEPARLTVLSPREALRNAKPLPNNEELAIDGLTDEEWSAFEKALAER